MIKIPKNIIREDKLKPPEKLFPELLCTPGIPKPLHGLNPRTIMGDKWWTFMRHKVYKRQGFCCLACGIHKKNADHHNWLEAHEVYEIDFAEKSMTFKDIVGLCHACHNFIHNGRLNRLLKKGAISKTYYSQILRHGLKVLRNNNIYPDIVCDIDWEREWHEWHLIFRHKKYYSKHKSFEYWRQFYDKKLD